MIWWYLESICKVWLLSHSLRLLDLSANRLASLPNQIKLLRSHISYIHISMIISYHISVYFHLFAHLPDMCILWKNIYTFDFTKNLPKMLLTTWLYQPLILSNLKSFFLNQNRLSSLSEQIGGFKRSGKWPPDKKFRRCWTTWGVFSFV